MSTRRCVTVLVTASLAALGAAPTAGATTKDVVAGGPPPTAGLAGPAKFNKDLDLNGFFRRQVTIHAGDSVRWLFSKRVVHTVTFLPPGQQPPALEAPDPAHAHAGFNDAAGAPFWFNGQPSISIPPEHAFPQGGTSTDGTTYENSGLSAPAFKPYKLKFTKAGTFRYICLVHPGMAGSVKVLPKSQAVPSTKADSAARNAEYAQAVKRSAQLARFSPAGNSIVAGHDSGTVSWFRFFPATKSISVGQSVNFSISSKSEIHTVAFGPTSYRDALEKDLIMAAPQPSGPPRLQFNPLIFLPSDPVLPPYTTGLHGNGFLNTGVLDTDPKTPPPSSATVTFAEPGTFTFECTIHPGMEATVTVS
jgi:plastocyanin